MVKVGKMDAAPKSQPLDNPAAGGSHMQISAGAADCVIMHH